MKKYILITAFCMLLSCVASAQQPTHRARFKYRITQSKLTSLTNAGILVRDNSGSAITNICSTRTVLKCLITNTNGILTVDPWKIKDTRTDPSITAVDPCYGNAATVNSNTPYPIRINIERGTVVGNPTRAVTFHYQTWLFGVNTIAVKFRPSVTDYRDSIYNPTAISGTINLGLTGGYSFGWTTFTHRSTNNWSVTPAMSLGVSSVLLSKEPLKKKIELINRVGSNFILSPALSIIGARNDIGIILSYGTDLMFGQYSSSWAYQAKRFFGIGLSAQFKL